MKNSVHWIPHVKTTKAKEKLTQDIICCGVWQTKEDIEKVLPWKNLKQQSIKLSKSD